MKFWKYVVRFLEKPELSETAILILVTILIITLAAPEKATEPKVTATPIPTSTSAPTPTSTATVRPSITAVLIPTITLTVDLYFRVLPYPLMRSPEDWTVSEDGVRFVAFWEGFSGSLYDDGGPGVGNCTIGYGHLLHLGPCNGSEGFTSISQAQAYQLLEAELNNCGMYVAKYTTVRITQTQYNILAGHVCNYGYDKYRTSEMLQLLNEGRYYEAAERMKTTGIYGIGIGLCPGLVRRRTTEAYMFIQAPWFAMWPFVEKKR